MLSTRSLIVSAATMLLAASAWAQPEANPSILGDDDAPASSQTAEQPASPVATRVENPGPSVPAAAAPVTLTPMRRGDILMARKRYREAIDTYTEGLHDAAVLYNKIGIAYHNLTDFRAALENYKRALDLEPSYGEAINNIGAVYYAQRKYKQAIRQYEEALKYEPDSATIYNNLGTAHFARKQYDKAFAAIRKAVELDPKVLERRGTTGSLLQERSVEERARYYYFLAKVYASQGIVADALLYIRKALEDGFKDRNRFLKEPEFAGLQENPDFKALMQLEPRVL